MKKIYLLIYYMFLQFMPMQPIPGYKVFYKIRFSFVRRILKHCGVGVVVKNRAYFGSGEKLSIGNYSQIGQNSKLGGEIVIGDNVLMGPDVVMMATSHAFERLDIPINQQGAMDWN